VAAIAFLGVDVIYAADTGSFVSGYQGSEPKQEPCILAISQTVNTDGWTTRRSQAHSLPLALLLCCFTCGVDIQQRYRRTKPSGKSLPADSHTAASKRHFSRPTFAFVGRDGQITHVKQKTVR